MRLVGTLIVAALVSGCSTGMTPGGQYPVEQFSVPVSYQEAYRRADAQPRECGGNVEVSGNIFSDTRTAVVRLRLAGMGSRIGDMVRVDITGRGDHAADVKIFYRDSGRYDAGMAEALRRSVESGSSVCRDPKYRKFG